MEVVFEEKASGTMRDNRDELAKLLHILGESDTLVVTRLDRLGRSPAGSRMGCATCGRVPPRTTTALRSVPVNDQLDRPVSGFHDHDLVARYEEPVVTQDWYPVQFYDWE